MRTALVGIVIVLLQVATRGVIDRFVSSFWWADQAPHLRCRQLGIRRAMPPQGRSQRPVQGKVHRAGGAFVHSTR